MMEYLVSSATWTGAGHRVADTPCQDKVHILRGEHLLCTALADGAGSYAHSEIGATLVTEAAAEFLAGHFDWCWDAPVDALGNALLSSCLRRLDTAQLPLRELSTTLLCCALHADGRQIVAHLGDGVIIAAQGEDIMVLSHPENGTQRNETVFVTSTNAAAHLRIQRRSATEAGGLLMMSDGMGDSLYHYPTGTAAPACHHILQWLQTEGEETVTEILHHHMENTFTKKSGDDLSIIVVQWS